MTLLHAMILHLLKNAVMNGIGKESSLLLLRLCQCQCHREIIYCHNYAHLNLLQ